MVHIFKKNGSFHFEEKEQLRLIWR